MFDLSSSGLVLRTLTPKQYGQLIDDLNYNFLQILNLPGFKGRPGESITGATGIGVRGSKWVFVQLTAITATYGITVAEQVNLNFINTVFNNNPSQFFTTLYIPGSSELLVGDILVLPNGQLVELAQVTINSVLTTTFIDTGITFAQVATITETRVIEIFNQLFSDVSTSEGAFRWFNAVAKNNTDSSPALNQNKNNDSVIDIVVPNTGPGAALPTHVFVASAEHKVATNTLMCLIAGSATKYHQLVQRTQQYHTNNYAPGVDDFAAHIVLQNSYKNGIIFGHKDSEAIRQFGRLYRSTNATILTSSYSPLESEYSELKLLDNQAIIRSLKATIQSDTMEVLSSTYTSKFFSFTGNTAQLANQINGILEIYAPGGAFLKNLQNAHVLSTDAAGKIVKTYSVETSMPAVPTNVQLLSASAINAIRSTLQTQIDNLILDVTGVANSDTTSFFTKQAFLNSPQNLNTLTKYGTYVIQAGTSISNFIPGITVAPADLYLNVYTSLIQAGTSSSRQIQEVTYKLANVGAYTKSAKYTRFASSAAGVWSFTSWTKSVMFGDEPTATTPIIITGDYISGVKISHASSAAVSTNNTGRTYVQNISLDAFGHIKGVESITIPEPLTLKTAVVILNSFILDQIYTIPTNLQSIITANVELLCISPEGGYVYGDITQAPSSGRDPDANFDHGISLIYTASTVGSASSVATLTVGDRCYVRKKTYTSGTTNADAININPAKWKIRVVFFYMG